MGLGRVLLGPIALPLGTHRHTPWAPMGTPLVRDAEQGATVPQGKGSRVHRASGPVYTVLFCTFWDTPGSARPLLAVPHFLIFNI